MSGRDDGNSSMGDLKSILSFQSLGIPPRDLIQAWAPNAEIPRDLGEMALWKMLLSMIDPPKRQKLLQYNTIDDAIELIKKSKNIMVLSGAGISTSAGLPDFRSRNGIYVQIHAEHKDLRDPKDMFDIQYFKKNPLPFYQFAKALFPGQFKPTIGHQFVKFLEENGKLLRNYSQNIDTLERQAGIERLVECHGSFSKASCTSCKYTMDGNAIREDVFNQTVPLCPRCKSQPEGPNDGLGVMKPNIVFFGEQLGDEFHDLLDRDKHQVDLLIVIGSSLKVRPVAMIPRTIPSTVPQILINRERLDGNFDIELLGDCDEIIQQICLKLGGDWTKICNPGKKPLTKLHGSSHILKASEQAPIANSIPGLEKAQLGIDQDSDETIDVTIITDKTSERDQADKSSEEVVVDLPGANRRNDGPKGANRVQTGNEIDNDDGAIIECDNEDPDDEDDWEDLADTISNASTESLGNKIDVAVPESSFIFIEPNIHIFPGAELTRIQYDEFKAYQNSDEDQTSTT